MKNIFKFDQITFVAILFFCFISCEKSSETKIDPNTEASNKIIGSWKSYKVLENSTDITNKSSGSFIFKTEKTFTGDAVENGIFFPVNGTWEVSNNGNTLNLVSNLSGSVNYTIVSLIEKELVLQYQINSFTRIAYFNKI